jgi:hypothetical protein
VSREAASLRSVSVAAMDTAVVNASSLVRSWMVLGLFAKTARVV